MSNFVCWWVFFLFGWVFFLLPSAKKNITQKKISPKTKLSSNGNTYILIILKQHLVRSSEPRDFWSVLWRKIMFQHKTSFIFIFYCGTVLRKTGEKNGGFIYDFIWHQKWNWLWFHELKWQKLWNRPDSVGKKKWNWRPRRSRVPSVSFFFQTESGGFIILCEF